MSCSRVVSLSFEPAHHRASDQVGGVLLDEMAGRGMVTRVRSLSIQFQVSLRAPGRGPGPQGRGSGDRAVDRRGNAAAGSRAVFASAGVARVVGLVIVQHAFHR